MNSTGSISSPKSVTGSGQVSSVRSWIFGGLTLAGMGLFLYAWFQPWWVAYIETLQQNGVVIYPHAMVISGTLRDYPQWIIGAEMPAFFFPLMWVFVAAGTFCLLASLLFTDEWFSVGKYKISMAQFLVGLTGFGYTVFVIVFPIAIAIRAPEFGGVQLQGNVFISMNEHTESYVISSLQMAYWMACGVGPGLLLLSFLRNKILGKS
jgi:hypothetical protein